MKSIGLFEVKTKLSEICEQVSRSHEAVVVTRRGKPFVRIEPIELPEHKANAWAARKLFEETNGPLKDEIVLPSREKDDDWKNPLD